MSYTREELSEALEGVGVRRGDVVFSHGNVGYFGRPAGGTSSATVFKTLLGAFQDVLGPDGTLVVPTFTYSFSRGQPFDPEMTPSVCGLFTEVARAHPEARRSADPLFSVAAIGPGADWLTRDAPVDCVGAESFWDRLLRVNGIICNLNFDAGSFFLHYVERCLAVPYRYDKLFTGVVILQGRAEPGKAIFFCRDLSNPATEAAFETFDTVTRGCGLAREAAVGGGAVVAIRARDSYALVESEIRRDPWFLTVSARTASPPILLRPSQRSLRVPTMPVKASMEEIIEALWRLPRDLVSDGFDVALEALRTQVDMAVHTYPAGTRCGAMVVPERWACRRGYVETPEGERVFSYDENPLHIASYSMPFDGEITRGELEKHLYTHDAIPEAVPFMALHCRNDWAVCCSRITRDAFTAPRYRVVIDACFEYGALKVGEVVLPGASEDTILISTSLCHPAMINDGLSGVAIGVAVARELSSRGSLRHTYRLLIGPEALGLALYLDSHPEVQRSVRGAIMLKALALDLPHALHVWTDGGFQACLSATVKRDEPNAWIGGADAVAERFWHGGLDTTPISIPLVGLSRARAPRTSGWQPYPEYQSSRDTPKLVSPQRLAESRGMVLAMIDALEEATASRWI